MSDEFFAPGVDVQAILQWPELADVRAELDDPRFLNRSHGARHTYNDGCRGPLCRLTIKLRKRARTERAAQAEGRTLTETKPREYDRDDLLLAIIKWHKENVILRRLEAAS